MDAVNVQAKSRSAYPLRRRAARFRSAATVLSTVVLVTCGREPTGPLAGVQFARGIALALEFPAGSDAQQQSVVFDRIRVTFSRMGGAVALDSTVSFPASADSIVLRLSVPLTGATAFAGEWMDLLVRCIAPDGDTIYTGGPIRTLVRAGNGQSPVAVPLQFMGPEPVAKVTRLAFNLFGVTGVAGALLGGSGGITVAALDSAGRTVPSFSQPITLALGENPGATTLHGTTTVPAAAGVAAFRDLWVGRAAARYTIVASTAGVPAVSSPMFSITAAAASVLSLVGGESQSGIIGTLLPSPIQVAVSDAYGNAVTGTPVSWQVLTGGGAILNGTTATDAAGKASNQWTLGSLLGQQTARAAVSGLTGSPVLFTASALPLNAAGWHPVIAPSGIGTTTAGSPIGAAGGVTVTILDAAGAVVSSFSGPVTMALGQNPGGATLGGTKTVTAQNGIATFTDLVITKAATGYTLVATAAGLPNITSNAFGIVAAAASALSLVSGNNQSALLNLLLPSPLRVLVADVYGNPVNGANVAWSVVSGGGALGSASTATNASGIASNSWTLGSLLGTQLVNAAAGGLTGSPVAFSATALPIQQTATQMVMSAIPALSVAGVVLDAVLPASSRAGPPK